MFDRVRIPVLGLVENMSYFVADDGKRYDIFGSGGGGGSRVARNRSLVKSLSSQECVSAVTWVSQWCKRP